jgi:hypothetical protein
MTQDKKRELDLVDQLLDEARSMQKDLPPGLSARVVADAKRLQPAESRRESRRGLRDWVNGLGGWPTFGGLVAASCIGFLVGLNPTDGPYDPGSLLFAPESSAFEDAALSGFGWDVSEG